MMVGLGCLENRDKEWNGSWNLRRCLPVDSPPLLFLVGHGPLPACVIWVSPVAFVDAVRRQVRAHVVVQELGTAV